MSINSKKSNNNKLEGKDDDAGKCWDDDDFEVPELPPLADNGNLSDSNEITSKITIKRKISDLACVEGPVSRRTRRKIKPISSRTRSKSKSECVDTISFGSKSSKKKKKKRPVRDVNDIAEEWIGKIRCERTHGDFTIDDLDQFTRKK